MINMLIGNRHQVLGLPPVIYFYDRCSLHACLSLPDQDTLAGHFTEISGAITLMDKLLSRIPS